MKIVIRELKPTSQTEINLVAERMRLTLEDVLGQEKGRSLYSMDWLIDRVKWHISLHPNSQVLLAESNSGEIIGQAIVRIERDEEEKEYGYFSTLYVTPEYRQRGVATQLVETVLEWCDRNTLPHVIYNTATTNEKIIGLFHKFSFKVSKAEKDMVQLKRG